MSLVNPWKSYRQVATQTAPPGQLVLMLFEGALRFLHSAKEAFRKDDPCDRNAGVNDNIQRAQQIIHELNAALDLQQGGEFARTMRALYEYFDRLLHRSNIQKHPDGLDEVIMHVAGLRDAWATMLRNGPVAATAAVEAAA